MPDTEIAPFRPRQKATRAMKTGRMVFVEIDVNALKRKIAEKNTTMEGLAVFLGMDRSTLYRKLRDGGGGVTVHEAHLIASFLELSFEETIGIFWRRRGNTPRKKGTAENTLSSPF